MRIYYLPVAIALCMMLPGCTLWQKTSETIGLSAPDKKSGKQASSGIDPEDIQDLEFEEDAAYLTDAPIEAEAVELIEEPTPGTEIQQRQMQQAQYGFKPVYFDFDQYTIKDDQHDMLDQNFKMVRRQVRKGKTVVIEGHACHSAGSPEYNMHLSEKRAESVKKYFVEKGISPDKLKVVGRGDTMCIVPSGNREQQSPNRRVEFYVLHESHKKAA